MFCVADLLHKAVAATTSINKRGVIPSKPNHMMLCRIVNISYAGGVTLMLNV